MIEGPTSGTAQVKGALPGASLGASAQGQAGLLGAPDLFVACFVVCFFRCELSSG